MRTQPPSAAEGGVRGERGDMRTLLLTLLLLLLLLTPLLAPVRLPPPLLLAGGSGGAPITAAWAAPAPSCATAFEVEVVVLVFAPERWDPTAAPRDFSARPNPPPPLLPPLPPPLTPVQGKRCGVGCGVGGMPVLVDEKEEEEEEVAA